MDKEKILRYYRTTDEDIVAARLIECAENVLRNQKYRASFFLSPAEMQIAEVIANSDENINVIFNGGWENAERNKAIFVHENFDFEPLADIAALEITWDKRYYRIAHKDVLGALLAICKREIVGDIVFTEDGAHIVCEKNMVNFLISNFTQVASAEIQIHEIPLEDLVQREVRVKNISATVSALRLDSVAAAGYSTSRTQMSEGIKMQQVKLNHKPAKNPAQEVKVGDIISYRGRGRVELVNIKGTTKKGRISIELNRTL